MSKPLVRLASGPKWQRDPSELFWVPRRAEIAREIGAALTSVTLYRWRFFDPDNTSFDSCTLLGSGDETGSTGNADITVSAPVVPGDDPAVGLRYQVAETNGKNWSAPFDIEYNLNTGGWTIVDEWDGTSQTDPHLGDRLGMVESTGGTYWSDSDGVDITTLTSASQQLGGTPPGTWENKSVTQAEASDLVSLTKNNHTELGFVFVLDWPSLANNDVIDIRVTGATVTNPVSSRITISKAAPSFVFPIGSLTLMGVGK